MKIKNITARAILDSRSHWTVEATIALADGARATASVPAGKSTGTAEAKALPATRAASAIENTINKKIRGKNFRDQAEFDAFLRELDGTADKRKLGANAILASSIAFLRASAIAKKVPLWRHIRTVYGLPVKRMAHPRLFINVVNGGLHAGNDLHFQEYLVIPKGRTIKESAEIGVNIYRALGDALARRKGKLATNIGDEGGYAPNFNDDLEPFRVIMSVAHALKYVKMIDFGLDAAATDAGLALPKLNAIYKKFIRQFHPIYIEDPFGEEAFEDFAGFTESFGGDVWVAGDDLTTTNVRRMERAHAERSVNAVIVKPNQIGSVTEALDAVRAARKYGWKVIASHRSGETNDDFIADFAYGVGADGLKLGAPARGERIAKYNRLLAIEDEAK